MSDLSDLLRRAEPPTPGFTPEAVVRRAAASRRRTWTVSAALTSVLLAVLVTVAVAGRPDPTVQVITPPQPPAIPSTETTAPDPQAQVPPEPEAEIPPQPDADPGRADELLGAIRDLPEQQLAGAPPGWRVRDGERSWWVTRGVNPDGTLCLIPASDDATQGIQVHASCGLVPFAIIVGEPPEEQVGVVVPDGYDRATHGGATVEVAHNVAILPSDGSTQPRVTVTGPAGTLDVHANLVHTAQLAPPQLALEGGRAADPEEIAAVVAEVAEPESTEPGIARAADGDATTTVVLRSGEPFQGTACIGLTTSGRTDASCIPMDQDARVIADGPLLTAVTADRARAYLVQDDWYALQLPDGRQIQVTANTLTIPADADSAVTGLLLRDDGRDVLVALHQPPDSPTATPTPQGTSCIPIDPPLIGAEGGTYEVQEGDTLSRIAESVYRDPQAFELIVAANSIGDVMEVGEVLVIPPNPAVGSGTCEPTAVGSRPADTIDGDVVSALYNTAPPEWRERATSQRQDSIEFDGPRGHHLRFTSILPTAGRTAAEELQAALDAGEIVIDLPDGTPATFRSTPDTERALLLLPGDRLLEIASADASATPIVQALPDLIDWMMLLSAELT